MKTILIILALISASCVTQKRCNAKFPPSITHDSIYIETQREVPVPIPGEDISFEVPINCPDQDVASVENSKLRQQIRILNRRLLSVVQIKPDTVYVHVTDTKTVIKEVKVPQPVKYIPQRFKNYRNICFLIFAIAFGFAGWKLYKLFK
jgi:hypothetical protein